MSIGRLCLVAPVVLCSVTLPAQVTFGVCGVWDENMMAVAQLSVEGLSRQALMDTLHLQTGKYIIYLGVPGKLPAAYSFPYDVMSSTSFRSPSYNFAAQWRDTLCLDQQVIDELVDGTWLKLVVDSGKWVVVAEKSILGGRLDGPFAQFYADGKAKYTAFYRDGILTDTAYTYFPSGAKETITCYTGRCNQVLSSVAYTADGKLSYLYTSLSPYAFEFWENGVVRSVSYLRNGKQTVWRTEYDRKKGKLLRHIVYPP